MEAVIETGCSTPRYQNSKGSVPIGIIFGLSLMLATPLASAQGFGGRNEVLSGDFNADGLTDLYLRQAPVVIFVSLDGIDVPIVAPSQVGAFVLQQRQDRTFHIVSGLNQTQLSRLHQWTETAIEVLLADVNADGREDLMLGGIGTPIPGADDLIVFAPQTFGSPPVDLVAIDKDFQKFFSELGRWIGNPNYFDEHAPDRVEKVNRWFYFGNANAAGLQILLSRCAATRGNCSWGYLNLDTYLAQWGVDCDQFIAPNNPRTFCRAGYHVFYTETVEQVTGKDYSVFEPEALDFASVFGAGGEILAGTADAATILAHLGKRLGVAYGPDNAFASVDILRRLGVFGELDEGTWISLGHILGIIRDLAELCNCLPGLEYIYHYSPLAGLAGIAQANRIRSGEGVVFLTDDIYFDSQSAKSLLALEKFPDGRIVLTQALVPGLRFLGTVPATPTEPGGGTEWTAPSPVLVPDPVRIILFLE